MRNALLLMCLLLMAGCSSQSQAPVTKSAAEPIPRPTAPIQQFAFTSQPVPSPEQIFALTHEQQQRFLTFYHAPENAHLDGHMRLYHYLDKRIQNFSYHGDTLSAAQTLLQEQGNCLSLAIVTSAFADLVEAPTEYQQVSTVPVYNQLEQGVLTIATHVRTRVYDPEFSPGPNEMVLLKPRVTIDYFPSKYDFLGQSQDRAGVIAMYYRNLAAEALAAGQVDKAFALAYAAHQQAPMDAENINLLAVVHKRKGLNEAAGQLYAYGLTHTPGSLNLVSNYYQFLNEQGRFEQAETLEAKVRAYEAKNPYRWLSLGDAAFDRKDYAQALALYQKTAELAPYVHQSYLNQALVYLQLGQQSAAEKALLAAKQHVQDDYQQQRYDAKLVALRQSE